MIRWISYAFRNLMRNPRRSLYTMMAVAIGFWGINFFGGFTEYIFSNLRESFIYTEGNGHLSIFAADSASGVNSDPLRSLLSADQISLIRELIQDDVAVRLISESLNVTGFATNGDTSTIYVGRAWNPSEKNSFQNAARGLMARIKFFKGNPFSFDGALELGISRGLADRLGLNIGSDVILMAPTVEGQINAVEAHIIQYVDTANELLEDKWISIPLELARSLYNTNGASQINLLLKEGDSIDDTRSRLLELFTLNGLDVDIMTWKEMSAFYIKVEKMFDVIFLLIFVVVSVIIIMSVVNTVTMSVMERRREIGTLRAIGAQRNQIISSFTIEGMLLGVFGCALGLLLLGLSLLIFYSADLQWTPPHLARDLPLEIYLVPDYLFQSTILLITLSLSSGAFAARKIAQRNIVEVLSHD